MNDYTMLVSTFFDNDPVLYEQVQEKADTICNAEDDNSVATAELADALKEIVESNNPLSDRSDVYNGLLRYALDEVGWFQLAEELVDERFA